MGDMAQEHDGGGTPRRVLVTGASSGIGRATARLLAGRGWRVVATARRERRLHELAAQQREAGRVVEVLPADLSEAAETRRLVERLRADGPLHALVHIAGTALGADSVEDGRDEEWLRMFEVNVAATRRLLALSLPLLREAALEPAADGGARHADIVAVTSTAARVRYEGGAGYSAAKAGEAALLEVLRLELAGEPLRIMEIAPGMVRTEEFTRTRLRGDEAAAAALYEGVEHPLTAEDVALVIAGALELPGHVNVDQLVLRPVAQAAQHKLVRGPLRPRTVQAPGEPEEPRP